MQKLRFLGLGAAMLAAPAAFAYQFEANGVYIDLSDADDSVLGVNGIYYFADVDSSGVPKAEAAFLRRASNVGATYATMDNADVDMMGIDGEFFGESIYGAASFMQTDAGAADFDTTSVTLGFMPSNGTLFSVDYEDIEDDVSTISLNAKLVRMLDGGQAYNFEASVGQSDDTNDTISYGVEGDYFFNSNASLGLSYADTDADGSEEAIGLRGRMFFNPQFSLQAAYVMQEGNDSVSIGVTGRF